MLQLNYPIKKIIFLLIQCPTTRLHIYFFLKTPGTSKSVETRKNSPMPISSYSTSFKTPKDIKKYNHFVANYLHLASSKYFASKWISSNRNCIYVRAGTRWRWKANYLIFYCKFLFFKNNFSYSSLFFSSFCLKIFVVTFTTWFMITYGLNFWQLLSPLDEQNFDSFG